MNTTRTGWTLAFLAIALAISGAGCSEKKPQVAPGPLSTNTVILIEPNTSVGRVRAGMTIQQAVAELGEPQRKTAHALEYTHLGLALLPSPDGVVQVVMCGDVTGINGRFVKAFAGRTKEGIGMRSTRDEVVKAYGEPTTSEKFWGGLESMKYQPLGITFTLDGGKVCHMIVRLYSPQEPDRTVTIEGLPGSTNR